MFNSIISVPPAAEFMAIEWALTGRIMGCQVINNMFY